MSKADIYEMMDKFILKENEEEKKGKELKSEPTSDKNLKGGKDFVCTLGCKTCGNI